MFPALCRCILLAGALLANAAHALECGQFEFPFCSNAASMPSQFAGGFDPGTGFGGFGGGNCKDMITRTPVIFIHGNGDSAIGWDSPALARTGTQAARSVYEEFRARGYNDCELFGLTYLDREEQMLANTGKNFHRPTKYQLVWQFIQAVRAYTGSSRVDLVAHSLGVSMSLAALDYYTDRGQEAWGSVRRFVNIAGGIHGLNSCVMGIVAAPTCRAEHKGSSDAFYEFGFFPNRAWPWLPNRWTAETGDRSLSLAPRRRPDVVFYTIYAGAQDDIHCPQSFSPWPSTVDCRRGPTFAAAPNVRAQIDVGADPSSPQPTWTSAVSSKVAGLFPRDLGGIGHFGARNYAGAIIWRMLTTDCWNAACASAYNGTVKEAPP